MGRADSLGAFCGGVSRHMRHSTDGSIVAVTLFFAAAPCWARHAGGGGGGDTAGMQATAVALAERNRSEGWPVWELR